MAEEQVPGPSGDGPRDADWLTIAAAARKLGVSPRAIRGRMRRGTIEWKPVGNTGRLVRVPPGDPSPDDPGDGPEDELDRLREELLEARIAQASAEAKLASKDELIVELRAMLADARRSWLERLFAGMRGMRGS